MVIGCVCVPRGGVAYGLGNIRACEPKLMPTLVVNTCKTLQVVFC